MEAEKRREEQRNFGVFFDDDYDYLQHLKESSGSCELVASGPSHFNQQTVHFCDEDAEEEEEGSDSGVPVSVFSHFMIAVSSSTFRGYNRKSSGGRRSDIRPLV